MSVSIWNENKSPTHLKSWLLWNLLEALEKSSIESGFFP
jgi:hypothetical protein